MSHIRNLLHRPSGHPQIRTEVSAAIASEDLSSTPNPVLGIATLPDFPVEEARIIPANRLVYYDDPRSPAADRFRLLRMRLKEFWNAGKLKKLLVTGPLPHTGKSTVVLNLATALAERGKHTVLVLEADLHHSSITDRLRLRPSAGLTECLMDPTSPLSFIRRIEPLWWYLLPAGEPGTRNPTELLQTPAFAQIMQSLAPSFDWILIDSPPVVPLTDSISMRPHADAALLVVRAGETPREAIEQSITLLGKNNILGIVLNAVDVKDHLYYQYYDGTKRYPRD